MAEPAVPGGQGPLLSIRHLTKRFSNRGLFPAKANPVVALDGIDLTLQTRSTLALVGASGSGKTTLALCVPRLIEPDSGDLVYKGQNILAFDRSRILLLRRKIQVIFQHPAVAMNPRFSVIELIEEPLRIQRKASKQERQAKVLHVMESVGIPAVWAKRRPLELSGGQRQRVAIARALILEPELLILDEALSSLDVPVRAQILDLLFRLQDALSLTYLYITHDLRLAAYIADRIAVMHKGRIVEDGNTQEVFSNPQHLETRNLINSLPHLPPVLSTEDAETRNS